MLTVLMPISPERPLCIGVAGSGGGKSDLGGYRIFHHRCLNQVVQEPRKCHCVTARRPHLEKLTVTIPMVLSKVNGMGTIVPIETNPQRLDMNTFRLSFVLTRLLHLAD